MKKETDTIYDLEDEKGKKTADGPEPTEGTEGCKDNTTLEEPEEPEDSKDSDDTKESEDDQGSGGNEDSGTHEEEDDSPQGQIDRMVRELGPERVLDLIRDNRNAAINQIIDELQAENGDIMYSGSSDSQCHSIFDLASMA